MIASVYILLVLIPLLNRGHIGKLPRDFVYTGLLYSLPLALVAAASAFGWMLAYLRGPDIVAGWIETGRRPRRPHHHAAAGAAVHRDRRFHGRGAGDHHLHADRHQADRARRHQAAAHGRRDHHHAGVRADHAALRAVAAGGVEIRRGARSARAMYASLPIYVVFFVTIALHGAVSRRSCSICRSCCCRSRSAASRARAARDISVRRSRSARKIVQPRRIVDQDARGGSRRRASIR